MDIYQNVTQRIVTALERGTPPWVKPWKGGASVGADGIDVNHASHKPYQGVNLVALWAQRELSGFAASRWLTYNQAIDAGGHVRKAEKGTQIVFWKFFGKPGSPTSTEDDGGDARSAPLARCYTVFNVEQCDGIELAPALPEQPIAERLAAAKAFARNTGAKVKHGGDIACYMPSQDAIRMPAVRAFATQEQYFAVLLHELTHWTGHETRCHRALRNRFGDEAYAVEELIAELGAAFACASLGVPGELRHESYIANWLKVLKNDSRAVFTAASAARKAHEYLVSLQPSAQASADEQAA
jgi:antirestriction protein ArdC